MDKEISLKTAVQIVSMPQNYTDHEQEQAVKKIISAVAKANRTMGLVICPFCNEPHQEPQRVTDSHKLAWNRPFDTLPPTMAESDKRKAA